MRFDLAEEGRRTLRKVTTPLPNKTATNNAAYVIEGISLVSGDMKCVKITFAE